LKKSTDIFIRILIVGAILGAIGYYYYKRFTKPVAPVLKSEIIKLPEKPAFTPKPLKKVVPAQTETATDNNSKNIVAKKDNITDNTTSKSVINYKITVEKLLSRKKYNELIEFLTHIKNIKFDSSKKVAQIEFKRVLIGPYLKKINLIKMEAKIRGMHINDYLRLKFKNGYYLHVGSFANKSKLEAFVTLLRQNRIYNIKYMVVKVPKKVFFINIYTDSKDTFTQVKSFLDNESIQYSVFKENNE